MNKYQYQYLCMVAWLACLNASDTVLQAVPCLAGVIMHAVIAIRFAIKESK